MCFPVRRCGMKGSVSGVGSGGVGVVLVGYVFGAGGNRSMPKSMSL